MIHCGCGLYRKEEAELQQESGLREKCSVYDIRLVKVCTLVVSSQNKIYVQVMCVSLISLIKIHNFIH